MRGRVSAVNNVFIGASNEIGGLESGLSAWGLAKLLGPMLGAVASVVLGGIGSILAVAAVAVLWPQMRRFGSLADARPIDSDAPEDGRGFEVITTSSDHRLGGGPSR
jgi:hypothetical protein